MMRWSINPVGGLWLVVPLAVVLLTVLYFVPPPARTTLRRRRILGLFRLAVILLALLGLLRPTIVYTHTKRQPATLILLVDRSRSMQVADAVGKTTRWDALRKALDDAVPDLAELEDDVEIKVYGFDQQIEPIEFKQGALADLGKPEGRQTALGNVLDEALKRESGKRLLGVVLLSDGAQRAYAPLDMPPQVPARRLADLGYRLYTVGFGQGRGLGQMRDVALENLSAPQTVFVKNQLAVGGTARLESLANLPIPVQLLVESAPGQMRPAASTIVKTGEPSERMPVELTYVPDMPGEIKVTLRAEPQPGELVTVNNEVSTFVTVLKGGLNVLYIEGVPRPEQLFLRRVLDASPDIKIDYLEIKAEQKDKTRPTDFASRFEPGKYDVYILGDLDSSVFNEGELNKLAAAVERGAGFMMLGGAHSFGAGGYAESVLADVLPVRMDRFERQELGADIRGDLHLPGKLPMKPTVLGAGQAMLQLAPREENAALWDKLPPLDMANRFAGLKANAKVLAVGPEDRPLLVASEYTRGRVLAFAGDSTWRWARHGQGAAHRRFWRQTILWLARKDESTEGNVWIRLARRQFAPGDRVEFAAGAESAQGEPLLDAVFEAEIVMPDGRRSPIRLRRQGENMQGSFVQTEQAGDYTLMVKASHSGQLVGAAQARFLIYEQDLELDNPAADLGLLDSLAAMTQGKRVAPEQLGQLLTTLKDQVTELDVTTETRRTLWDSWPFFLAFAGLMCGEWYLRKRWGLV